MNDSGLLEIFTLSTTKQKDLLHLDSMGNMGIMGIMSIMSIKSIMGIMSIKGIMGIKNIKSFLFVIIREKSWLTQLHIECKRILDG